MNLLKEIRQYCYTCTELTTTFNHVNNRVQIFYLFRCLGEPRCGKTAPKLANGQQAICNPDGNDYCCSSSGFCGSGKGFCECNGCINHRTTK